MGNRLCKKKNGDVVDISKTKENTFDRIITRLHMKPNAWRSESQLSKQVNRISKPKTNNFEYVRGLSKSSDWVEASLEVSDEKNSPTYIRDPKLDLIFNQKDSGTPTPPPRKHKKGIREKLEVAKNSLAVLQWRKPVEEPLCVKKKIIYDCPCDHKNHKSNHSNHSGLQKIIAPHQEQKKIVATNAEPAKLLKRQKNMSVVSLPNYNDLKFSITNFDNINKESHDDKDMESSRVSLPGETKASNSKNYMIRCRSFGSLLPQQLFDKLKPVTRKSEAIESDDSFGPLEDWDLGLLEHYNPRDASLPRPRKQNAEKAISNIENSIIKEDSNDQSVALDQKIVNSNNDIQQSNNIGKDRTDQSVEHSSLMRILEKFSIEEKNKELSEKTSACSGNEAKENRAALENFIETEKLFRCTEGDNKLRV